MPGIAAQKWGKGEREVVALGYSDDDVQVQVEVDPARGDSDPGNPDLPKHNALHGKIISPYPVNLLSQLYNNDNKTWSARLLHPRACRVHICLSPIFTEELSAAAADDSL